MLIQLLLIYGSMGKGKSIRLDLTEIVEWELRDLIQRESGETLFLRAFESQTLTTSIRLDPSLKPRRSISLSFLANDSVLASIFGLSSVIRP